MPRRLLDQDRQRERRAQFLLLDRLSAAAEREMAQELENTSKSIIERFADSGQVQSDPEHQRRVESIMKRMWSASIEALGGRIREAAKARGLPVEQKQEDAFDLYMAEFIERYGADKVVNVSDTTITQIKRQIEQAREEGLAQRDAAEKVLQNTAILTRQRASVIARTETHAAGNYGAKKQAERSGLPMRREWIAADQPGRTRRTHLDADGQTVLQDEPFNVGGHSLMYPGDPSGPAEEVINCRCAVGYIVDD